MRVIGVIDLAFGRAVHARGGHRARYAPVDRVGGSPIGPGDGLALARAYLDRLEVRELYVADLDAIVNRSPEGASGHDGIGSSQETVIAAIAGLGAPLWLDAGVSSLARARHVLTLGAAHVIVGLETLTSYRALERICEAVGGERVAFSLDLRHRQPVVASGGVSGGRPPAQIAARAVRAGVGTVIVLDMALVGAGAGLDFESIAAIRESAADATLVAGGGVRGPLDLARLSSLGCDGALVATTLQDGTLGPAEVLAARGLRGERQGGGHRRRSR